MFPVAKYRSSDDQPPCRRSDHAFPISQYPRPGSYEIYKDPLSSESDPPCLPFVMTLKSLPISDACSVDDVSSCIDDQNRTNSQVILHEYQIFYDLAEKTLISRNTSSYSVPLSHRRLWELVPNAEGPHQSHVHPSWREGVPLSTMQ